MSRKNNALKTVPKKLRLNPCGRKTFRTFLTARNAGRAWGRSKGLLLCTPMYCPRCRAWHMLPAKKELKGVQDGDQFTLNL